METNGPGSVLNNFSIEKKAYRLRPINQGFINDTFLVMDDDNPLYILQRINTTIFSDVDGIMGNIRTALEYLSDTDYNTITLLKTLSGESFYKEHSGNCWRLMTYINDSTTYDITTNDQVAYEAGRIIGKFHKLLQAAPLENFVDIIPRFHDLEYREEQFYKALETTTSQQKSAAKNALIFTQETLPKLKKLEKAKPPVRICHNDTKLNNILFSKKANKALCLIDLDTVMKGYFYYDFGDAVRTIVSTAPEDEKEHHKITFDKRLFQAFVNGLSTNADFLAEKEIALLPFGTVLMPFLHGIRALTDYLNGNIYYKVAYENQNLDRCLSLYDFSKKALDEIPYMEKVVHEILRC